MEEKIWREFGPRFLENYSRANRQKLSTTASKESIIRVHLVPSLGKKKLDDISDEDVQRLKFQLQGRAPSTTNTVLTVLSVMLKTAMDWGVIQTPPCTIKQLRVPPRARQTSTTSMPIDVSSVPRTPLDRTRHLIVLPGGESGVIAFQSTSGLDSGIFDGGTGGHEWSKVNVRHLERQV